MKKPQKAIILAAGLGTRMHPLSLDTPKPLMPLWGKPLISHLLKLLAGWNVKEILLNLHFNPSPICEYFKREPPANLRISFSFEPEILGTGGVLRRARWFLGAKPFWMVNSDIAADLTPFRLLAELEQPRAIAALWMEPERGPRTVEMQRGNILNFQTSRPGTKGTYTFCGLQLISPSLFNYLPSKPFCSIVQAYQNAVQDKQIIRGVCVPGSYWADLGTPESYLKAHAEIRERHFQKLPGKSLFNPRQDRQAAQLRKKDVSITGFAAIDQTAKIHPAAKIENSIIWRRAVLGPEAVVQNAIVGSECEINGRVPRLAVKTSFNGQYADIQLNLALARLKLARSQATIMPFEPRGSARSFTRIIGPCKKNYIMIRYSRERHENCLYARHAEFLKKMGLNVPAVIADFPERQFILMQDLGDISLQQIALNCPRLKLMKYYRRVLEAVLLLHGQGAKSARREQLEMVAPFSPDLYLWERDFFSRFFLTPYLRQQGCQPNGTTGGPLVIYQTLASAGQASPSAAGGWQRNDLNMKPSKIRRILAELAEAGQRLHGERQVLIHRDLQSSNILFHKNKPYFIDFQGMRFGPAAYDLASLLCDPYISLPLAEQNALLDFYNSRAGKGAQISPAVFWRTGVQRLCQALGAYGRLAANNETRRFAQYIPPALRMMRRALEQAGICPRLLDVICRT